MKPSNLLTPLPMFLALFAASGGAWSAYGQDQTPAYSPASVPAQQSNTKASGDDVVSMNVFEVKSTADQGYFSLESAGMKSDLPVLDVPQSIDVLTSDVITDLSENHKGSADSLKFVSPGLFPITQTEANEARGARATTTFLDGLPDYENYGDLAFIDSIDVLKGPEAVLYGTTAIDGTLIKNTRKPLDHNQDSFTVSIGSYDFFRGVIDTTGPILHLTDGTLDYRSIEMYQQSNGFVQPTDPDNRIGWFPSLQLNLKDTIVRFAVDFLHIARSNFGSEVMVPGPNGYMVGPWQGAGKYQGFRAPWEVHNQHSLAYRGSLIQRFSDNWDMHLYAEVANIHSNGNEARPNANPNFAAGTMQIYELDFLTWGQYYQTTCDFNGKFSIYGSDWVTSFGATYSDEESHATYYKYVLGTVSLYAPNPLLLIRPGAFSQFTLLEDIYTDDNTTFSPYLFQTVYLFDRHIIVSAGTSYVYLGSTSHDVTANTTAVGPNGEGNPYRLGLIYKPIEGFSLYFNHSTTFSAQANEFAPSGQAIGNTQGSVTEGGLRTDLFDNRITGTIDYFETLQTNIGTPDPDLTKGVYYFPTGTNTNKGIEGVVGIEPIRNWTIVGTYYSGDLENQAGAVASDAVNHSGTVLTKYSIKSGALKGWAIGADWYHQGRRWESAANGYGWPGFSVTGAMLEYSEKTWSATLRVDNVQNRFYSDGGFSAATWADFAEPREIFVNLTYRFL